MKGGIFLFLKRDNNHIDKGKINDILHISNKILRVFYVLIFIVCIYVVTIVSKEWKILTFLLDLLKIIFPLFMGLVIAWIFEPLVKKLTKRKIRRGFAVTIVYLLFLGVLALMIGMIIPLISDQINDFAASIPSLIDTVKGWIQNLLNPLEDIKGFDVPAFEKDLFQQIANFGMGLMNELPMLTVEVVKTLISGFGTFLVGLVIGFYMLISFEDAADTILTLIPKNARKNTKELMDQVNTSLRSFVNGALVDCSVVFLISSIAFTAIGLKASLIFGLFCGVTNVIPYAGPYIGGAPAVLVGFAQGPTTGILTLISIVAIQFIEGNFLQPFIMSKTTKLHPVTIILGLLIFGHFFGIIGMVVSTPIIAVAKTIFFYFDRKYQILNFQSEEKEE